LLEELTQLKEEGKLFDYYEWEEKIKKAGDDKSKLMELYNQLCNLPDDPEYPYNEPSEYGDMQLLCETRREKTIVEDQDLLYKKIYGAWYGRCIGCALGQPVELWSAENIRKWCEKADAYPLDFYIPAYSRAEQEDGFKLTGIATTREHITHIPTDDDIRYTVCGLHQVQQYGLDWDSWSVGLTWHYMLPYRALCTAENQAYLNFANIDENGPWGRPENAMDLFRQNKVNTYLNPYREWIGAQIRIDAYGYIAAGDPHTAARLAYHDAYFSHVKNGIYGAMFFAALIAAAIVEKDINCAIERALREIPVTSRFYEAMKRTLDIVDGITNDEELISKILEEFKSYHPVHTISNAAICLAAIKYSQGDFHKAITLSVMAGLDTDCNGATVGSVMGAFAGIDGIPEKWKKPINDTLYSGLADYNPIAISELAKRTMELYIKYKTI